MSFPSVTENSTRPILPVLLMRWFYDNYLQNINNSKNVKVSPMLATDKILKLMPPAIVVTAEFDRLRDESEAYGRRLTENGVNATIIQYKGQLHGFFSMLGLLDDAEAAHWQVATLLRKYLA